MYHISDIRRYLRCPHLFLYDKQVELIAPPRFIRIDEEISDCIKQYFSIESCFQGKRGDPAERALQALNEEEWLVKARFEYANLRIKVPFMHRFQNDKWDIYFVFQGLYPPVGDYDYYAYTIWALEQLQIKIHEVYIIHFNAQYIREDELDIHQLFVVSDCFYNQKNHPSLSIKEAIKTCLIRPIEVMQEMDEISLEVLEKPIRERKCSGRMKCRHYEICFPEESLVEDNSILTLFSSQHRYEMHEEGIRYLKDVDLERLEGYRMQYAQIRADQLGGLFVDYMALNHWLSYLQYPIAFIDFEWERYAIPPFHGLKPFDVVPFEYSIHILKENGEIEHNVFLSTQDDRQEFLESLLRDIPENGSVVAYNAYGAESIRLKELAIQFPQYQEKIEQVIGRMKDLQVPFEMGLVYDVRMKGQWSLKTIMAMMDDKGYNDLEISHGMDAVYEWRHLDRNENDIDQQAVIDKLKAYCGMDTYAMVVVYQWLCDISKKFRNVL